VLNKQAYRSCHHSLVVGRNQEVEIL
jgi:hypothetical protein